MTHLEMKTMRLPRAILAVFGISFVYWVYLALRWSFCSDVIGYKELGGIFYRHGLIGYASTGLHREPLYPFLCSLAMSIQSLSGITFTHVMAGFSVLILVITQILMYIILRELNIRTWVCSLTLLYWALSTAITSSAFNMLLFCEIITYPFITAAVIAGYYGWKAVKENNKKTACCWGAVTGVMFMALTFVKAVFECICPLYLLFFMVLCLFKNKISTSLVCFLAAAGILFYVPVIGYKSLNKIYNGNYAIADRGPNTLYGVAAHRTFPFNFRSYLAKLTSVAGDDVCIKYFREEECSYWSWHLTDALGADKMNELKRAGLPPQIVTEDLLGLSIEKVIGNLPKYTLLTATESLKAYFWEGTNGLIPLHFIMAILTFFSMFYCFLLFKSLPDLMKHVLAIILFFIFFNSLFEVSQRHFLPVVPLYLLVIGYAFNSFFRTVRNF